MVWEIQGVITYARKLIGATGPKNSDRVQSNGTLLFLLEGRPDIAKVEISLWFKPKELVEYIRTSGSMNHQFFLLSTLAAQS